MPEPGRMINAARDAKQRFDELLLRASVHDTGEARVSAIYLLTISEQFAAVLHLVEGGFSTHALVNVRSMLEGLSDLLNVVKSPGYVDQIRFDSAFADVALFKECAIEPQILKDRELFAALKVSEGKAQLVLEALKARGIKRKATIEQFRQAGISENYVAFVFYRPTHIINLQPCLNATLVTWNCYIATRPLLRRPTAS